MSKFERPRLECSFAARTSENGSQQASGGKIGE